MTSESMPIVNGHGHHGQSIKDKSKASAEAMSNIAPQTYCENIQPVGIFLTKYQEFPSIIQCTCDADEMRFHVPSILDYLQSRFSYDSSNDVVSECNHRRTKEIYTHLQLVEVLPGLMVYFDGCNLESEIQNPNKFQSEFKDGNFLVTSDIRIFFRFEHHVLARDLFCEFKKLIVFASVTCTLQMVCRNQHNYYLSGIKIKKPLITDMGLHYGQKFVSIHNKILKSLNQKEGKGLVLLHGLPGSGKTHYIRYLIQEIQDKTLIYIPPDMAKEISSPSFLPFLMEYPDSILIIEDAENIIKDRTEASAPTQAVANLLNLSDGLLGDAMHQQIIATFNCDLTKIDPALLRKGRLIANYEFGKLDIESSKILSEKLGFPIDNVTEPMTLAEIYNQCENESTSD